MLSGCHRRRCRCCKASDNQMALMCAIVCTMILVIAVLGFTSNDDVAKCKEAKASLETCLSTLNP